MKMRWDSISITTKMSVTWKRTVIATTKSHAKKGLGRGCEQMCSSSMSAGRTMGS